MISHAIKMLMKEYDPGLPNLQIGSRMENIEADVDSLSEYIERYAFERHYKLNPKENEEAAKQLRFDFLYVGCDHVYTQGKYNNVVAEWGDLNARKILITGHYDSPPQSPGADDNASALAVMLETARLLSYVRDGDSVRNSVRFVAFNREEEGLLGSADYAANCDLSTIDHVINLEMVGYYTDKSGTQMMPQGFPSMDVGNFLAVIGNRGSGRILKNLITVANRIGLSLPIKGINIPFGLENSLPGLSHVTRSDHSSFWNKGVPAVMLTDTSEFRNKNYHQPSDLPETLDYEKMASVVELLVYYVLGK